MGACGWVRTGCGSYWSVWADGWVNRGRGMAQGMDCGDRRGPPAQAGGIYPVLTWVRGPMGGLWSPRLGSSHPPPLPRVCVKKPLHLSETSAQGLLQTCLLVPGVTPGVGGGRLAGKPFSSLEASTFLRGDWWRARGGVGCVIGVWGGPPPIPAQDWAAVSWVWSRAGHTSLPRSF